jgi:hypothetical protein
MINKVFMANENPAGDKLGFHFKLILLKLYNNYIYKMPFFTICVSRDNSDRNQSSSFTNASPNSAAASGPHPVITLA